MGSQAVITPQDSILRILNSTLQIGSLKIKTPVFLAPMAGVTDYAFRLLCRELGAGMVYSEFVSADGIIRENAKTLNLIRFSDNERPIGIQIFGSDPTVMYKAASYVTQTFKPDVLDINYGCPVPKITKRGAGAAALKDLSLMDDITSAVIDAAGDTPVTVKMRAGWNKETLVIPEIGPRLVALGVQAISLHPRTVLQGYSGVADWSLIRKLKHLTKGIPVIGNGDIKKPEDVLRMFEETRCDGVMVGRAALGNPWFFRQVIALMRGNLDIDQPSFSERIRMCQRHFDLLIQDRGETIGSNLMRKHFGWYIKGFPGAAKLRQRLVTTPGFSEMKKEIQIISEQLVG